jgi:hypothetical protein
MQLAAVITLLLSSKALHNPTSVPEIEDQSIKDTNSRRCVWVLLS